MKPIKSFVENVTSLVFSIKDRNLAWQRSNQADLLQLSRDRSLANKTLETELAIQTSELAHTIALLKTRQNAELAMLKTRCKEDVKDYQDYLAALNQLKTTLQKNYSHLPEAITLTIHHHAKALLNNMWEAENLEGKRHFEAQLVKFMATVHEEIRILQTGNPSKQIPEHTLRLIQQETIESDGQRS